MPYVPPWLQVSPSDFVQAAAAGGRLGAQIAGQTNEARMSADRNQTALQEANIRANTELSGQSAAQQEAAARLAAEQKQQEAANFLRQWEVNQQIKRQQDMIAAENLRNQNTIGAENSRAAAALAEREKYGQGMLDVRSEANRIAQQRADQAAAKPSPQDFNTVSEHTPGTPAHSEFTINNPGTPSRFFGLKSGTPPSILTTTNADDLLGLPPGATISTNKVPAIPSITSTRRIPIAPPQPLTNPLVANPTPQRVMVQDSNGNKFTLPENQLQDALSQGYKQVQ